MARETLASVKAERDALKSLVTEHEKTMNELWVELAEVAEENEFCEVFDQFAEDHGRPGLRNIETSVSFTVGLPRGWEATDVASSLRAFLRDELEVDYEVAKGVLIKVERV